MTDKQKKWHAEFVQWKAIIILVTIMTSLLGIVYGFTSSAVEMAQINRGDIIRINTTQIKDYAEISKALDRIEKTIGSDYIKNTN